MAVENFEGIFSLPAAADYSAITKPRLVVINTSGQYVLCGAGAVAHAVADNFPVDSGKQVRGWLVHGIIKKCEVGSGGVTRGAKVSSDASGKLVVSATSTHAYVGIALEAAADGEVAQFLFIPTGIGAVA